jgi:hypothetical protein
MMRIRIPATSDTIGWMWATVSIWGPSSKNFVNPMVWSNTLREIALRTMLNSRLGSILESEPCKNGSHHLRPQRAAEVKRKPAEYRQTIGDVVYTAMVDILKAPKDDRFQVIADMTRATVSMIRTSLA